jgi:hypothetical protein
MIAQHSPRFAGDNRILVFDNRGGMQIDGKGGSQIIGIDVASHRTQTVFPKSDDGMSQNFYSHVAGHFDLEPAGSRALVSVHDQGRIIEVDLRNGQVLWEYANVHDISEYLQSNGEDASPGYALFSINSAYYVRRPAFLK